MADSTITTGLASEAGHWYRRDGTPAYDITGANGKQRPVTLRDARKEHLLPGVTSIIKLMAAPGLTRYQVDQGIMAALTLPRQPGQSEEEWLAAVKRDAQEHAKQAAEFGTAMHAAIERSYQSPTASIEAPFLPTVLAVRKVISETFGTPTWIAEKSFAAISYGYGCRVDLCSLDGQGIVIDFKGRGDWAPGDKEPSGFDEQAMQLAGCRVAALRPRAQCANVFFSRSRPGLVSIQVWKEPEIERGWKMLQALLDLYYAKTGLER